MRAYGWALAAAISALWAPSGPSRAADAGDAPAASSADADIPVWRIFNDDAGASHIERTVWRSEPHQAFGRTDVIRQFFQSPAYKVIVVGGAPGFHAAAHNTGGAHELVFLLQGRSTAKMSDGVTHEFQAGDVILLDDVAGEGTELTIGPEGYLGLAVLLKP